MKRIVDYRKIFGIDHNTPLAELKLKYRGLIKEWHPDKFPSDEEKRLEAEHKSKSIIEGYHFLVSISPETHALNAEHYLATVTDCSIDDYEWKGQTLKVTFQDGSTYEYFGVPRSLYIKMVNSSTQGRFVRRHVINAYPFRNISKNLAMKA
ncbi:MAG: KTSC domain-containing protein [bacterium]|nr:KTSC domain-containing protein [bacterium]